MKLIDVRKYDGVYIRPRKERIVVNNWTTYTIPVGEIGLVQFIEWVNYHTVAIFFHNQRFHVDINEHDFFSLEVMEKP